MQTITFNIPEHQDFSAIVDGMNAILNRLSKLENTMTNLSSNTYRAEDLIGTQDAEKYSGKSRATLFTYISLDQHLPQESRRLTNYGIKGSPRFKISELDKLKKVVKKGA